MAKITWTSEASRWLKDIYDYVAEDNPVAAANVINEIYNKAQILKDFPEIGYKYDHDSEEDIRILLYGHYRITYLLSQNNEIVILGIFHGALDIKKYIL